MLDYYMDMLEDGSSKYYKLFEYLNSVPFWSDNPMDQNRTSDGMSYREFICDRYDLPVPDYEVSVLEIMMALARRMYQIQGGSSMRHEMTHWITFMLKNLGLETMTNDSFSKKKAAKIVSRFLNREYRPDGYGGLFYIRNTIRDMREFEIWKQMMIYLNSSSK